MRRDKVIHLFDDSSSKRKVLAKKKSIKQNEFYQAVATGLRPEIAFEIWTREYNEERYLTYNGKDYTIIRSYEPDSENIELICEGAVATEV